MSKRYHKKTKESRDIHDALSEQGFFLPRYDDSQTKWLRLATKNEVKLLNEDQVVRLTPCAQYISAETMRQALGKVESLRPYFYPAAPGKDYASYVHSVVNSITTGSAQALETAISQ